jgi:hypothetical protein
VVLLILWQLAGLQYLRNLAVITFRTGATPQPMALPMPKGGATDKLLNARRVAPFPADNASRPGTSQTVSKHQSGFPPISTGDALPLFHSMAFLNSLLGAALGMEDK